MDHFLIIFIIFSSWTASLTRETYLTLFTLERVAEAELGRVLRLLLGSPLNPLTAGWK